MVSLKPKKNDKPIYDGDFRLLEYIPERQTSIWVKTEGKKTTVRVRAHSAEGIVALNKIEQNMNGKSAPIIGGYMRKVASVPSNVAHEYLHKSILDRDKKRFAKWLNNSDHKNFRVSSETV